MLCFNRSAVKSLARVSDHPLVLVLNGVASSTAIIWQCDSGPVRHPGCILI